MVINAQKPFAKKKIKTEEISFSFNNSKYTFKKIQFLAAMITTKTSNSFYDN